jgi:hypothetical protein
MRSFDKPEVSFIKSGNRVAPADLDLDQGRPVQFWMQPAGESGGSAQVHSDAPQLTTPAKTSVRYLDNTDFPNRGGYAAI